MWKYVSYPSKPPLAGNQTKEEEYLQATNQGRRGEHMMGASKLNLGAVSQPCTPLLILLLKEGIPRDMWM